MRAWLAVLVRNLARSDWVFAILVSLAFIVPISTYVVAHNATIAPLNILSGCCGWQAVPNNAPPNNIPSDVTDFVLPDRFFVDRSYAAGQIPLWNPSYFGGELFLANIQSTVLHPVNLFYLVTNEMNVQTISVVMSLFLLCMSMVLMLRELERSRAASALGGIALAGSCFAIFWASFGMMTWMMAAAPFAIYLFLKWQKTGNNTWLGLLSLCLGVQIYFGHIQFSFLTYVTLVSFALYYFFLGAGRKRRTKKTLGLTCLAVLFGVIIGAAQLLPFLEEAKSGHRQGVALLTSPASWQAMWLDIKHFFAPYSFKNPVSQQYFLDYGPFRFSLGLLPAVLVLAAIYKALRRPKESKDELFFIVLFIMGMFWMWGNLPQEILNNVAGVFKSLNPIYFMALPLFAAAALAAYGFDHSYTLVNKLNSSFRRAPKRKKLLPAATLVSLLIIPLYPELVGLQYLFYKKNVPYGQHLLISIVYALATVALLVFSLGASTLVKSARLKALIRGLPFLFVLLNALLIFKLTAPVDPKYLYAAGNPYFTYILKDSKTVNPADVRIISPYDPQTNLYYGLSTLNGYDSLYAKDIETLIHAINYPQATFQLSSGPHGSHNAIYVGNTGKTALLQNLGVAFIIADSGNPVSGYAKIDQVKGSKYALFKSDRPAPQVYFAGSVVKMSYAQQLKAIQKNSLAYHQVATNASVADTPPGFSGTSTYNLDVNEIHITTNANKTDYLLVGQTYDSQWQAYIDGRRASPQKADYNFMALQVPAGKHRILFIYKPASFIHGVELAIVGLVTVFGYVGYAVWQNNVRHWRQR